ATRGESVLNRLLVLGARFQGRGTGSSPVGATNFDSDFSACLSRVLDTVGRCSCASGSRASVLPDERPWRSPPRPPTASHTYGNPPSPQLCTRFWAFRRDNIGRNFPTMRDWKPGPPRPPSSQPWSVDARDPLMVLDRDGQIVAVTTSRSDADWIVRCVNAVASLPADALDRTVLDQAIHVLREPSRFHS